MRRRAPRPESTSCCGPQRATDAPTPGSDIPEDHTMALERLFQLMAEKSASDLFLAAGSPITIKINGVCVPINQERLQQQAVVALLTERLSDAQFRELERTRELNLGLPVQGVGSFRLSAYLQRGSVSAVIRYIPHEIPRLEDL